MSLGILHAFIIEQYGVENLFLSFYILNLIFSIISYKLGFARKLPLVKSLIVYILLAVGVFVITIFSVLGLPMTESLIIISLVLAIYRFRLHRERQSNKN